MRLITMPDGKLAVAEHITGASVSGSTVTVTRKNDAGSPYTFTADNPENAANIAEQVNQIALGQSAKSSVIDPALVTAIITSIEPAAFNLFTDTILIHGFQFNKNTIGRLYLEDAGGGEDSNGTYLDIEFLNPNLLQAKFGGIGDGVTTASTLIYYLASDGKQSNVINGTSDGIGNVTIP